MTQKYRFGFTGTQRGMTTAQRNALRDYLRGSTGEFHHGDCIGADSQAQDIAEAYGYHIIIHPPSDPKKRAFRNTPANLIVREPKPYLDRNKGIVLETMVLIACPGEVEEQLRSGTWATVRFARKQSKSVTIIFPDGAISQSRLGG